MISLRANLAFLRRILFVALLAHWFLLSWIPAEQLAVCLVGGFLATAALAAVMMIEANEIRRQLIDRFESNLEVTLNNLTFRETFLILNARGKQVRKHPNFRIIFYSLLFVALFGIIYISWTLSKNGTPRDPNIILLIITLYLLLASILFLIHVFRFSSNEQRIAALTEHAKVPISSRWTGCGGHNPHLIYEVLKMFLG